ncbi:FAD-binding and (Fe-S)-binding domain-containing protein [Halorientalis litorea]|uniref:FAD-binding and (Fe-S)-binding domain-containing protein n=1 Tax=Halorientalis litorea TaxID=2931977 RepID=UPI001FF35EEC|nr:FAD-binding and (Fe-S)-binding domain-containing protein [Halorientalis litorea]
MATERDRDPASDGRAGYDYAGGDIAWPGLVDDLDGLVDGEVRFDDYSRQLYATDASIYQRTPIGVVFPRHTADVAAVVGYCAEREIPVLPRGGGTSLAGQSVNRAVVLDTSRHMDGLVGFDAEERRARAQPGITLGRLNAELAESGLKFAPDPAWGDKSVLGGAIGNNSTGAHSLQYGKTDAYVEEIEVVLADGTVTTFGELSREELDARADPDGDLEARIYAEVGRILDQKGDAVESAYPDLKRNVSGYNLDWVVDRYREEGVVDVAGLLAGSEGTLAVVTEAVVSLEPVPETKALALLRYEDLLDAMADVAPILDHDPAAVEVLDDVLLDLARDTAEFGDLVDEMVPEGVGAVLLVEFYADDDAAGREKVADLLADRAPDTETLADPNGGVVTDDEVRARSAAEAHDEARRTQFWKLRKSGLPILLSRTSDAKHQSFVEDTAVPPENLPAFVADFQQVLEDHDTSASFYAHAGPGVLHIRPLVNTKTDSGVATMESIADTVTDLVVEYGGSVSGEHGDGRARTQWNKKLYGEDLWETFADLKTAFDPDWILNPGQVVSRADRGGHTDMTEHLRAPPDGDFDAGFESELAWDNENGMQGMVELCHGCGGCRGHQDTTGGVMCPTYRAANEEELSTRGRANMLRGAMTGDLPEEQFTDEFVTEVLDLCIGCKGCAKDCPSGVDMAKLKAELTHEYHQREGTSFRERLFADIDRFASLGSLLAPLSNWLPKLPGARAVMERTLGIASERSLPTFHRQSFADWFGERGPAVPAADADHRVLLLPDTYTNYSRPDAGKAAVRVLEAAGVHVDVPAELTDSGRPAFSKGFLDRARATARENVTALAPRVREGWDVLAVEPSDAVMYQSDYLDLLGADATDDATRADAETVAANTYGVLEYLDARRLDDGISFDAPTEDLTYHGHCHQKTAGKDHHAVGILRRAGYAVDPLDSGCCGMAGSFGYEAEHYSMSRAIGSILFDQVADSDGDTVVAPGASCRTQLGDRPDADAEPPHPIEKVAAALGD